MKVTLLIATLSAGIMTHAQSIEPQVIGSNGNHYTSTGAQLSFTAGEVVIETVTATNSIITQGFHQPAAIGVGFAEKSTKIQMNVFPNPTFHQVSIAIDGHDQGFDMRLFDSQGKLIIQDRIKQNTNNQTLDVSKLAAGTYVLRMVSDDAKHVATFNLQKMK